MPQITLREGTAAEAAADNPVLAVAEPGYETDTKVLKFGDGVTAWNSLPAFATPASLPTVNPQTTDYTLVLGDAQNIVKMTVGSANNLTVPTNASVAFPLQTSIDILQYGSGSTSIIAAGGVTLRFLGVGVAIRGQYGYARLRKIDTDEWTVERGI